MRIFLNSFNFDLLQVVLDDYMDLKTDRRSWVEKAKKDYSWNAKAMNTLFFSLSETKYMGISEYYD